MPKRKDTRDPLARMTLRFESAEALNEVRAMADATGAGGLNEFILAAVRNHMVRASALHLRRAVDGSKLGSPRMRGLIP